MSITSTISKLAATVASANGATSNTRALPVGYARIIAFSRDRDQIGRVTLPLGQAVAKFEELVAGKFPDNFGFACLYGWIQPDKRLAYTTYRGVHQLDMDGLLELENAAAKLVAPVAPAKPAKPAKPTKAAEDVEVEELAPF